ncbi:zinc finger protein 234 [Drosophila ficusphila]|uniref:zinc finger protein 234 n=1 Tax=Drosophila ficusphila TaxID=30025 RepID=UPI0007E6AA2F|nr:zinc finger protein 234 [Drosophila ficusphila]
MGRIRRKTVPRKPKMINIKSESNPEKSTQEIEKYIKQESDQSSRLIKTENSCIETYPQTEFYEVGVLGAGNSITEEYPLEDEDNVKLEHKDQEGEDEISYYLAGPPKVCSKCFEAFPVDDFPTHNCKDINADKYPCKICPRKFRYKSMLIIHLKSHLRLRKGERMPELEAAKLQKPKTKNIFENKYSPTPKWKLSRRRAGLLHNKMRVQEERLCHYCPIAFSNEAHLEKHLRDHHAELINKIELILPDPEYNVTEQVHVKLESEESG